MNVVGIGGGTGLPVLLTGLRELRDGANADLHITAIVTVADDGGSTGKLRRCLGMPAMGDLRNCLVALAAEKAAVSAHDLSDGGLTVALAECCFDSAGDSGACLSAEVDVSGQGPGMSGSFGTGASPILQSGERGLSSESSLGVRSFNSDNRESQQIGALAAEDAAAESDPKGGSPGLQSGEHGLSGRATSGASSVGALAPENAAAEFALFGERGARAIISLPPASLARATAIAAKYRCNVQRIGTVIRGAFRIQYHGTTAIRGEVSSLREIWSETLAKALESA